MQIVPCNIRQAFNGLVGDTVLFNALGITYNITVTKQRKKILLHGEGWEQFVHQIKGGKVLLVFNMTGPKPSISVAYEIGRASCRERVYVLV